MKYINSIDDRKPDDEDIKEVQRSKCLNCERRPEPDDHILFTRIGEKQKLIWWHKKHCQKWHARESHHEKN